MSTLDTLQLRKHDLRCTVKKSVKADGRKAMTTQRVWHKIIKVEHAEGYLLRRA